MKLDDSVIAHIAKLVQMAILTGTDVVDNLRQARLTEEDGSLFLDPEYKAAFLENIEKMQQFAATSTTNQDG